MHHIVAARRDQPCETKSVERKKFVRRERVSANAKSTEALFINAGPVHASHFEIKAITVGKRDEVDQRFLCAAKIKAIDDVENAVFPCHGRKRLSWLSLP